MFQYARTLGNLLRGDNKQPDSLIDRFLAELSAFFTDEFIWKFCRQLPLLLSLLLVFALTFFGLGNHFGVPNLIRFGGWIKQTGVGFALTLVVIQSLYIGFMLSPTIENRKKITRKRLRIHRGRFAFLKYASMTLLCLFLFILLILSTVLIASHVILPSDQSIQESGMFRIVMSLINFVQDYGFLCGVLAAGLLYIISRKFTYLLVTSWRKLFWLPKIQAKIAKKWWAAADDTTRLHEIIETEGSRLYGALISFSFFVISIVASTYCATWFQRTVCFYLSLSLFFLLFIALIVLGPKQIRWNVLKSIGLNDLITRKNFLTKKKIHSVRKISILINACIFTCLSMLSLMLYSFFKIRIESPITIVCALWLGLLACYVLVRGAPAVLLFSLAFLLILGGQQQYKFRFYPDFCYQETEFLNLNEQADSDRIRLHKYEYIVSEINRLKTERRKLFESQNCHLAHNNFQDDQRDKINRKIELLQKDLDTKKIELHTKNKVIVPNVNWPRNKFEEENGKPVAHNLLSNNDIDFNPRYYEESNSQSIVRDKSMMPLIVIAVSGGGLRSAAWTYRVLKRLEFELARQEIDFPTHVRLICGASGGMLGAAYYVANLQSFEERKSKYQKIFKHQKNPLSDDEKQNIPKHGYSLMDQKTECNFTSLTQDCLTPVVRYMIFHDFPWLFSPSRAHTDRGIAIQESWRDIQGVESQSLYKYFCDLKPKEKKGEIPSLVFTPMMVEDGRRMLISNLDLQWVVRNGGDRFGTKPFSSEALELFRLFPKYQNRLRLCTAIRMSASFPLFSPPAVLPTIPRRRLVDAGYYDNYGVSLAASWLFSANNQLWLNKHKRILFIQIRDGLSDPHRKLDLIEPLTASSLVDRALEEFTTPLSGIFQGRDSTSSFRNDGMLEVLNHYRRVQKEKEVLTANFKLQGNTSDEEENYFRYQDHYKTLTIEYSGNASLSWYLSSEEIKSIISASHFSPKFELVSLLQKEDIDKRKSLTRKTEREINDEETEILKKVAQPKLMEAAETEISLRGNLDDLISKRMSIRIQNLIYWWKNSPTYPAIDNKDKETIVQLTQNVIAHASIGKIENGKNQKISYHRYCMWLDTSQLADPKITEVTYYMDDPTFLNPLLKGNSKNNFKASYIGHGSIDNVIVKITTEDKQSFQFKFNQSAAIYNGPQKLAVSTKP